MKADGFNFVNDIVSDVQMRSMPENSNTMYRYTVYLLSASHWIHKHLILCIGYAVIFYFSRLSTECFLIASKKLLGCSPLANEVANVVAKIAHSHHNLAAFVHQCK